MDTLNEVREDGCIDISVYRKPTHTDKYLHFDSHQPIHHKAAVAKSLYSRAAKVSSSPLNKRLEVEHINRVLESDGYPKEFLRVRRTGLTNRFQKLINNSNKIIAVNTKNHSCEYPHIRIPAYPRFPPNQCNGEIKASITNT